MKDMLTFEFLVQKDLFTLKKILHSKIEGFQELQKDNSGYYYLLDLMEKVPTLKFKNEKEFYGNLTFIIQEFPVMNNGKIGYGMYFNHLADFQEYIRKEFGFLPKNRIFWRRLWTWWFVLFCFITMSTGIALLGGIMGLILAIILANRSEKRKRKKGIVLGVIQRK